MQLPDEGSYNVSQYDYYEDYNYEGEYVNFALPEDLFCDLIYYAKMKCATSSLLEIWKFDHDLIANLTDQDVINDLNIFRSE